MTENYVVIIAASVPILNALIKRAKEHYGDGTELSKMSTSRGITVKNTWSVHRVDACGPTNTVAFPDESFAEEKVAVSTHSLTYGMLISEKGQSRDDATSV